MTKQVQIRRGTATQHTSFTGAEGEISINTTNDTVHVHDGLAAGGVEMARSDLGNVLAANVAAALAGSTLSSITLTTADINGGTIDGTIIGNTTPAAGNFTSGSFTGNLSFGDNAKAIFGAGSDLQIYHDGSNSYVKDAGTGDLYIQGTQLRLQSATGESFFVGVADGSAYVYHNGSAKLTTTSTGIDVTGTVTADGLTVNSGATDEVARFEGTGSPYISWYDTGVRQAYIGSFGNNFSIVGDTPDTTVNIATGGVSRVTVDSTGVDVTGTVTADGLTVSSGSNQITLDTGDQTTYGRLDVGHFSNGTFIGTYAGTNAAANILRFGTSGSERARLDASGNWMVGGTTAFGTGTTTINSSGLVYASRSGNKSGHFNRESSDGEIAVFSKDGTTVGSISSVLGSYLQIGTGDTGVVFQSLVDSIIPHTGSATRDNAISLGTLSGRFKNLYLGGTASISDGTSTGTQTLVGGNYYIANSGAYPIVFQTSGSERARLDVSGNLLVGTTSNNVANQTGTTQGVRIAGGSIKNIQVASTGTTAYFNRLTTDGNIAEFRKNGSPVGSIGTQGGAATIGNGVTGLRFSAAGYVHPHNITTNTASDNTTDLGASTARFKDLYLGGGVYLGGTGAANKLDDYEEGTWTPTLGTTSNFSTTGSFSGTYTKIGRVVKLTMRITGANTFSTLNGYFAVGNLPFTPSSDGSSAWSTGSISVDGGGTILITPTVIWFYGPGATGNLGFLYASLTYVTTA